MTDHDLMEPYAGGLRRSGYQPKPIVDLKPKPSGFWRRAAIVVAKPLEKPEPYRAQPCEPATSRVIAYAIVAVFVAVAIVAFVLLGLP
jgi:hypothetical protein